MSKSKNATKAQRRFIARNYLKMTEAELADRLGIPAEAVRAAVAEIEKRPEPARKARAKVAPRSAAFRKSPRATALCILAIVVVAVISYLNSFNCKLIFDNKSIIVDNAIVRNPANLRYIWTADYWAGSPGRRSNLYRPITIFSFHINYHYLGGKADRESGAISPVSYHVVNMLLHAGVGVLVYFFVFKLLGGGGLRAPATGSPKASSAAFIRCRLVAVFAALLFVAHPIQTEAVTNTVGRADILAMGFALLALLSHMKGSERGRRKRVKFYIFAAFFLLLGLLSKESAIVTIVFILALDVMFTWRSHTADDRVGKGGFFGWFGSHAVKCYSFYAVAIAAWFIVREIVLPVQPERFGFSLDNPLAIEPFFRREFTAAVVLGLYLWRLFFPLTLSADYSFDQIPVAKTALDPRFLCSISVIIALFALAALFWKRNRVVTYFVLFFFIAIAPVSNVFVVIGTIAGERLLYMPSLAWCVLLSLGVFFLFEKIGKGVRKNAYIRVCILLGIVVGAYAVRTIVRNEDWRDEFSFWKAACEASPNSAKALHGYAEILAHKRRNYDGAIKLLEKAIRIAPKSIRLYSSLGNIWGLKGERVQKEIIKAKTGQEVKNLLEKRNDYYRTGYEVVKKGVEVDEIRKSRIREELIKQGMDESKVEVPGTWWEVYLPAARVFQRMSEVCDYVAKEEKDRGNLEGYEKNRKEAIRLLEQAVDYCKESVLGNLRGDFGHKELAIALFKLSLHPGVEDRDAHLKEARVSHLRAAIVMRRLDDSWRKIARELGLDEKPANNIAGIKLAARSLIMLFLAKGDKWNAEYLANRVSRKYKNIRPDELSPLLKEEFSKKDPKIWKGE